MKSNYLSSNNSGTHTSKHRNGHKTINILSVTLICLLLLAMSITPTIA